MLGQNKGTGANLRLPSKYKKKKKRVHSSNPTHVKATRDMLESFFDKEDGESKKTIEYSLFTSLIILAITLYITFPQFVEHLNIEKEDDVVYIPAGGNPLPPSRPKREMKKQTREEVLPQLYPEIRDMNVILEDEEQEDYDADFDSLAVDGNVDNLNYGLGGSGGGPIIAAGAGGVIPEPELIYRVEPDYPEPARRARIDGFVLMQAIINRKGEVVDIKILQTPPAKYGFAEKAKEAVSKWKFKPSYYKGKPVSVRIRFSVEFNLVY